MLLNMTKKDIEEIAVSELKKIFAKTKYIDSHFNSEDKEPCWDGYLTIHDNLSKAKGNSVKRINVQIKGKHCNDLSKNEISFTANRTDLNSYFGDGGCLYFVVLIDENYKTKIYYLSLLPMKIKSILNGTKGKEKINIHLHEMPNDVEDIDAVIKTHYRNKELQPPSICDKALKIENISKFPNISELYTTIVIPKKSDPFEYLVRYDTTKYALIKDFDISVPIEEIPTKKIIELNQKAIIANDGIKYYDQIRIVYTEHDISIHIGDCFSLKVNYDCKTRINYHIEYPRSLKKIVENLPFIVSLYKNNGFDCNGKKIELQMTYDVINSFNFSSAENNIIIANKFKSLLDKLKIKKDIILDLLNKRDWDVFWYLYNGLILNKKYIIDEKKFNSLNVINIRGIKIIVAYIPIDNKVYEIKNVFETEIPVYCIDECDKKMITQFSVFKIEDLYDVDNIDYDFIFKSIKDNTYDEYTEGIANSILLKLISAYDKSLNKDIINICIKISNWLFRRNQNSISYELNRYQLKKRLNTLDKKEIKRISKIANEFSEHDIRFGCFVLLGKYNEAKSEFTKLDSNVRKEYEKYPIYNLYAKLKS